ncbi:MAG TPA: hypothetical protein VJQ43_03680 [Thermoplasmata archaeon]|nr:hypothetical protein [Thermoplasmata archaeon]
METGASSESGVPDSSHVGFLYRGVVYGRSFLTWYVLYGATWLLVLAIGSPLLGDALYVAGTGGTPSPGLEVWALLIGTFVAVPLAVAALLQGRRVVRVLFRDFPPGSPWVGSVLRPIRRRYWAATGMFVVGTVSALGFYVGAFVVAGQYNAGQYSPSEVPLLNGYEALLFLGVALSQLIAQIVVVRAFSDLIAGSEIPKIDRDRERAVRVATWTSLALAVVGSIAAGLAAYSYAIGPTVGEGTGIAMVAPIGLLVGALLLRRAYGRWLELAYRLIGRRPVV